MYFDLNLVLAIFLLFGVAIFLMGLIWQYEDRSHYSTSNAIHHLNKVCLVSAVATVSTGILILLTAGNIVAGFPIAVMIKSHMVSLSLFLVICPFTKYIKDMSVPFYLAKRSVQLIRFLFSHLFQWIYEAFLFIFKLQFVR
ncbi:hypothetical protein ACFQ3N_16225 [Virgibacillus byunsanensis]|uniref:Uncharacterized protein n=1 Tax=Virgibacillus byunsanensis TaxID=570945 RepID=A0ABW3LNE2_9BACI